MKTMIRRLKREREREDNVGGICRNLATIGMCGLKAKKKQHPTLHMHA